MLEFIESDDCCEVKGCGKTVNLLQHTQTLSGHMLCQPHNGEVNSAEESQELSLSEGSESGCFGCLEAGHSLEGHTRCNPTKAQSHALYKREGSPSYENNEWIWHPAPRVIQ